jgi:hypothetical protein
MASKRPPINHNNNRQISQNAKDIADAEATIVINTAAIALNTAKVTYDGAAQVATNTADIATNVAAIALNTAKVTYDAQAAVAANTLKVSYPPSADAAIALNTAKVTYPSADAAIVAALPADTATRLTALEAKMEFAPKAFGRFTTANPAVLLGTSYNVTSVTRGAAGQYAVVLETDMTTANYTVLISYEDSTATIQIASTNSHATTGFNIGLRDGANAFSDASESVSFAVFENNT